MRIDGCWTRNGSDPARGKLGQESLGFPQTRSLSQFTRWSGNQIYSGRSMPYYGSLLFHWKLPKISAFAADNSTERIKSGSGDMELLAAL